MKVLEMKKWQIALYFANLMNFAIVLLVIISLAKVWSLVLVSVIVLFIVIYFSLSSHFLKKKSNNLFIFGPKGYGKDIIMQKSIELKYNIKGLKWILNRNRKPALANDDYGFRTKVVEPKEVFNLYPNTYKNFIESKIAIIKKNHDFEGRDYYLTDATVYFPSQEDSALNKKYPSFPLFYALSRHIYDMNIIVNTQVGGRLWKKLREQVQDGYIEALGTKGWSKFWQTLPILRRFCFVRFRFYSKLESAENGLLPFKKLAIANQASDRTIYTTSAGATKEQYEASNGTIKEYTIAVNKKHIKYDTRVFHEKLFGYKAKDMLKQELKEQEEARESLNK
jgi:hypothetical protein